MLKFDISFINRIKSYLFFAIIFLFICALSIKNNALDCDLWARLVNGQHVFYNFIPLKKDIYSYAQTHIWYDPEWLSSAFLYFVQKVSGIIGLTYLKIFSFFFLICFLVFLLYRLNVKNSPVNFYFFVLFSLISSQVGYLTYTTRCQVVTFFLFALWLYILEKTRKTDSKLFYFLPIIMIFWQNFHGGCIAGFGVLFVYFIGELLNKKQSLKYLIMLLFVFATLSINPWGVDYYSFLYKSSYLDRSFITEWRSIFNYINLHGNLFFFFVTGSILAYIFKIFAKKETFKSFDKTKLLMIILLSYLSIFHLKHIMLAMIGFIIYLYDDIMELIDKINTFISSKLNLNINKIATLVIFKILILIYSIMVLSVYSLRDSYYNQVKIHYPIYAMEFLKLNDIKGKILSSFQVASFLGYKYYPDYRIYVDGRQEQVYESETVKEILDFIDQTGDNPSKVLDKYKPDIVILEKNSIPAIRYLNYDKRYSKIYLDNYFYVYVLNKYKKNTSEYKVPNLKETNFFDTLFDTNIKFTKDTNK